MTTTWKRTQRYLNPLTDFGFKRLFGTEMNKELLISFLNALFHNKDIRDVSYLNSEQLGDSEDDRRSVFDVYCEDAQGDKFTVRTLKATSSLWRCRTSTRSSSRTGRCTTPPSLSATRERRETGTSS